MQQSSHPRFHDHSEEIREHYRDWQKAELKAKQEMWQAMFDWIAMNYKTISFSAVPLAAIFYVLAIIVA